MDQSGRISNFFTLLLSFLSLQRVAPGFSGVAALIINIVNALNLLVMVLCMTWSFKTVQNYCKDLSGILTFSDSLREVEGGHRRILPNWDIPTEIRHRVWETFWDGLLLKQYPQEVLQRLEGLKWVAQEKGKKGWE